MVAPTVVAVGELLWDLLPDGKRLGGAPGNVAHHARRLGAEATLISRVGRGDSILDIFSGLQQDSRPTGTAAVVLDAEGQPHFKLAEDVAWDYLEADDAALDAVRRADAVYYGTLAQRGPVSRATIRRLLREARPEALRVCDLNLRDPFWTPDVVRASLEAADVVKLGESELDRIGGGSVEELARRYDLDLVALTRGARGSLLWSRGEKAEHPGIPVRVVDAIGAGDAFTAALIVGLLRGAPLETISRRANELAAWVCTQPGATPDCAIDPGYFAQGGTR